MAGLVASCHDCSEGGLAVALAETAFAGGLGMAIDLAALPEAGGLSAEALLFAESASRLVVTVNPAWAEAFEATLGVEAVRVGVVTAEPRLRLACGAATWIDVANEALEGAWRRGLTW
jgi:phosphoribosylformylglycinamidine synthase